MRGLLGSLALALGLVWGGVVAVGQAPGGKDTKEPKDAVTDTDAALDEAKLQTFQIATDGKSLLEYVQKRTYNAPDPKLLDELTKQLGDDDYQVREQAYLKLMQLGPAAANVLKQAIHSEDAEARKRASDLLKQIESEADPIVQSAVIRLIGQRQPKGSGGVLLAFLPVVAEEQVAEEILLALNRVAFPEGKADPALIKALDDKLGVKRRAAALALARAGGDKELTALLPLLKDPDQSVRLDVALALITSAKEKQAIPVVIDLLKDQATEQLWAAEDVLRALAGAKAPAERVGADRNSHEKAQKAWLEWWDNSKGAVDFSKLETKKSDDGTLIIVQVTNAANPAGMTFSGEAPRKIMAVDKQGKEQWSWVIHNTAPVDVLQTAKDKIALVEYAAKRISLRTLQGVMEKEIFFDANPIGAELLPKGNMLVVFNHKMIEIDKDGNRLPNFDFVPTAGDNIARACKPRDNLVVYVNSAGMLHYIEPATRALIRSFPTGIPGSNFGGLAARPDGHVLVPVPSKNIVLEFNPLGKIVRRYPVTSPSTAIYLPNGHILVGSQSTNRIEEINRQGKSFSSAKCDGAVYRIHYN